MLNHTNLLKDTNVSVTVINEDDGDEDIVNAYKSDTTYVHVCIFPGLTVTLCKFFFFKQMRKLVRGLLSPRSRSCIEI